MNKNVEARLKDGRVARFATQDAEGRPHVVPICYAYDGRSFYTALDLKPKRLPLEKLARARHIGANPNVALLVDEYCDDWEKLWYILVRGRAEILTGGVEREGALRLLREKYAQYASGRLLPEETPVIRIVPVRIVWWGKL